jgi:hypothetical protein
MFQFTLYHKVCVVKSNRLPNRLFSFCSPAAVACYFLLNFNQKERNDAMIVRFDPRPEDLQRLRLALLGRT